MKKEYFDNVNINMLTECEMFKFKNIAISYNHIDLVEYVTKEYNRTPYVILIKNVIRNL